MKKLLIGSLLALTLAVPATVVTSSSADALVVRVGPRGVGVGLGVRRGFGYHRGFGYRRGFVGRPHRARRFRRF